jgi:predicted ester cyclase
MVVEENKANLYRTFEEVWNKGNWSVIPEVISPDYDHGNYKGHGGYKQLVTMYRTAFPDIHITIDQVIGEGDWLAYRFTAQGTFKTRFADVEPTGKKAEWSQWAFTRYKDGKVVTNLPLANILDFYQQVGTAPPVFRQEEERNKVTLRRLYDEVWNKGNMSVVAELVSPDYDSYGYKGVEGYKQLVINYRTAFPDIHNTINRVIGEGDWLAYEVTTRGTFKGKLLNIEPTGKEAKWVRAFFSRYKDGKVMTAVAYTDTVEFYQQIGVPPPGYELAKK